MVQGERVCGGVNYLDLFPPQCLTGTALLVKGRGLWYGVPTLFLRFNGYDERCRAFPCLDGTAT